MKVSCHAGDCQYFKLPIMQLWGIDPTILCCYWLEFSLRRLCFSTVMKTQTVKDGNIGVSRDCWILFGLISWFFDSVSIISLKNDTLKDLWEGCVIIRRKFELIRAGSSMTIDYFGANLSLEFSVLCKKPQGL